MIKVETAIAPYLVLLLGKLTKWNWPHGDGGETVYLGAEEIEALAAEGIRALSTYLHEEVAGTVNSALDKRKHSSRVTAEPSLLKTVRLPVVFVPRPGAGGDEPGCCVEENGRLVCVR